MLLELIGYSYHIFFGTAPVDGFETSSQQNEPKPHKNFKTVMVYSASPPQQSAISKLVSK